MVEPWRAEISGGQEWGGGGYETETDIDMNALMQIQCILTLIIEGLYTCIANTTYANKHTLFRVYRHSHACTNTIA